jgi:hypothetical protein
MTLVSYRGNFKINPSDKLFKFLTKTPRLKDTLRSNEFRYMKLNMPKKIVNQQSIPRVQKYL